MREERMNDLEKTHLEMTRTADIARLQGEIREALRTLLDKANRLGKLLTEQKTGMDDYEWEYWVTQNCPIAPCPDPKRATRDYLRFFDMCEELRTAAIGDEKGARRFYMTQRKAVMLVIGLLMDQKAIGGWR